MIKTLPNQCLWLHSLSRDIASPDLESATSAPNLRLNSFSQWIRTGPRQVSWAKHKGVLVDKMAKPQLCCMIQATKYMDIFSWYSQGSQNHDVSVQSSTLKFVFIHSVQSEPSPMSPSRLQGPGYSWNMFKTKMDRNNLRVNVSATLSAQWNTYWSDSDLASRQIDLARMIWYLGSLSKWVANW